MIARPTSLKEVAERTESLADFGLNLRDWLHQLRRASSRGQVAATIADEPPRLAGKFPEGRVADAWLAAYAEHLAGKVGQPTPSWAFAPDRVATEPSFADDSGSPALRTLALVHSPLAFKRRNIFTPSVDLPLRLRAGRPVKPMEEKRKTNADRQRRFRKTRLLELTALRKLARKHVKLTANGGAR